MPKKIYSNKKVRVSVIRGVLTKTSKSVIQTGVLKGDSMFSKKIYICSRGDNSHIFEENYTKK